MPPLLVSEASSSRFPVRGIVASNSGLLSLSSDWGKFLFFVSAICYLQQPARSGPGRSREPGTASQSPTWVAGAQALEPLARSRIRSRVAGTQTGGLFIRSFRYGLSLQSQSSPADGGCV